MVLLYILLGVIGIGLLIGVIGLVTGAVQETFGVDTEVYFIKYKDFRYFVDREVKLFDYTFRIPLDGYAGSYGYTSKEEADRAIKTYKLSKVTKEWKIDETKKE